MEPLVNFAIAFQAILLGGEVQYVDWPSGDTAGFNPEGKLVRRYITESKTVVKEWAPTTEEIIGDWMIVRNDLQPHAIVCDPDMADGALLGQSESDLLAAHRMYRKAVLNQKPEEEAFVGVVKRYSLEYLRRTINRMSRRT